MNIKKVSFGIVGATLMAGIITGCSENKYADKAKTEAVKYLNGDELLKAERFANQQSNNGNESGEAIAYWDSLLIEAKSKEAYLKGQQVIRDSVDGNFFKKEKFKLPLDTVVNVNRTIINSSKEEFAKYVSGEEFIKARNNAPEDYIVTFKNNFVGKTHYWNLINMAGKQNEAYQKGMADERNKYNDSIKNNKKPEQIPQGQKNIKQMPNTYKTAETQNEHGIIQKTGIYQLID